MWKRNGATRPLEAIQIDHAKVDVVVVDDGTGRELGRPWIAMGVDVATRVVTGFQLTMAPPTRLSASLCLLHSVCDKTRWLEDRRIPFEWPVSGLPESVLTDSNSFFGPRAFVRACKEVGIKNVWNDARDARYGAHIESMIGTRIGDVPLLTDAALTDRSEQEGCGRPSVARLSMAELESWIGAEIAGKYHRRRHAALRRAPIAAWRAQAQDARFHTPVDCVSFRVSFLPEEECVLEPDGVRLLDQTFWSRALADDFDAGRTKLTVRYDPRDLSRIFVKRPSGRFVKALNADALQAPGRCGGTENERGLEPALSSDVEELIMGGAPNSPVAGSFSIRQDASEESRALALADCGDDPAWSVGAAHRDAICDETDHACPRKCVASCPFQFIER